MADSLPAINQPVHVFAPDGPATASVSENYDSDLNHQLHELVGPTATGQSRDHEIIESN